METIRCKSSCATSMPFVRTCSEVIGEWEMPRASVRKPMAKIVDTLLEALVNLGEQLRVDGREFTEQEGAFQLRGQKDVNQLLNLLFHAHALEDRDGL